MNLKHSIDTYEPYQCKYCDYQAKFSHNYSFHLRKHGVNENHICDICDKSMKTERTLKVNFMTVVKPKGAAMGFNQRVQYPSFFIFHQMYALFLNRAAIFLYFQAVLDNAKDFKGTIFE